MRMPALSPLVPAMPAPAAGSPAPTVRREIHESHVHAAQRVWSEAVLTISQVCLADRDYRPLAAWYIRSLFAGAEAPPPAAPPLPAAARRLQTFEETLSYFVGGAIPRESGLGSRPWIAVRFEEQRIIVQEEAAFAVGHYAFRPAGSEDDIRVDFSFGYLRGDDGRLRINLHHASIHYDA